MSTSLGLNAMLLVEKIPTVPEAAKVIVPKETPFLYSVKTELAVAAAWARATEPVIFTGRELALAKAQRNKVWALSSTPRANTPRGI